MPARSKFSKPFHLLISDLRFSILFSPLPKWITAAFFAPSKDNFLVKYLVSIPKIHGILFFKKNEFKSFSALQFEYSDNGWFITQPSA